MVKLFTYHKQAIEQKMSMPLGKFSITTRRQARRAIDGLKLRFPCLRVSLVFSFAKRVLELRLRKTHCRTEQLVIAAIDWFRTMAVVKGELSISQAVFPAGRKRNCVVGF
jgi:hypothetical protein